MRRTIKRVDPLTVAKVFGAMYFVMGLALFPLFLIPALLASDPGSKAPSMALGLAVPFLYGALGFVATAGFAWLYNVLAARVGGIELVFDDDGAA